MRGRKVSDDYERATEVSSDSEVESASIGSEVMRATNSWAMNWTDKRSDGY